MKPVIAGCVVLFTLCALDAVAPRDALAQDEHPGSSLTLAEAIGAARSRAADAREARAAAEGADAAADAAVAGFLPNASAQASGNRSWTHSYQPDGAGILAPTPSAAYGSNVGGAIRWTAWDFGRTTSAVGGAKAESRSAAARSTAAGNEAAKVAAALFLTAVFDEELVSVAQTTLNLRERHANLSKALVTAGMRPPVEEARARVELALARLDVTAAERQLAQDRVRLAVSIMADPSAPVRLVRPSVLPTVSTDARRAAEQAEQKRPELRAAVTAVEAREEALDAAKAERLPRLGLSLEATHVLNKTDDDARVFPTRGATALLTATIPIFDWSIWGAIPVARAGVSAAEARKDGVRAQVRGQAAEASYVVQAARALVDQAKAARELASATLAVMEARYQAGLASPFDLFDAAKKDAEARTATIRAELQLATATVEALFATGRIEELSR